MIVDITGQQQLQQIYIDHPDAIVLVDFWAEWCGPCRMLGPVLHEISAESEGKIIVCKVDVDEEDNGPLAQQYGVVSIPQVNIFQAGKEVDSFVGALQKEDIQAIIAKYTSAS